MNSLALAATTMRSAATPWNAPKRPRSAVTEGLDEPFAGADGQAEAAILAGHPAYEPWFAPLWEPPSGEIESLLFALQAALGAGLLGYYLGLRRGQTTGRTAGGRPDRTTNVRD